MNDEYYTIQEAAAKLKVSTKTLRRWEEKNILIPLRSSGNQRRYSQADIQTLTEYKKRGSLQTLEVTNEDENPIDLEYDTKPAEFLSKIPTPFLDQQDTFQKEVPVKDTSKYFYFHLPHPLKSSNSGTKYLLFIFIFLIGLFSFGYVAKSFTRASPFVQGKTQNELKSGNKQVLGASTNLAALFGTIYFNIPAEFDNNVTLDGSTYLNNILIANQTSTFNGPVQANKTVVVKGKLTAPNILYGINAGQNITITGNPQNPTISAISTATSSGVTSLSGATGAFTVGSGLSLAGNTLSNSDAGSSQDIFKNITVGGSTFTAGSNNDTLTFSPGSGISISSDTTNKIVTISSNQASSPWSTNGSNIYYTGGDVGIDNASPAFPLDVGGDANISGNLTLGSLGEGVVHSDVNGLLTASPVDLGSADITGTLPIGNGGTGLTSISSGALLYGSAGSSLNTLSVTGSSGECLVSDGNEPTWQSCPGGGGGSSPWTLSGNVTYPNLSFYQVGIGTTTVGNVISSLYVTRDQTSGALGKALAIFNQTESQDILTASSSGTTEFTIGDDGTLTDAKYTTNGALLYGNGSGVIQQLSSAGSSNEVLLGGPTPAFGSVDLTADVSNTLPVGNGGTGITSLAAGAIAYGNGTTNPFATLAPGTTGQFLTSNGGTLSWESSSSVNYWQLNNGALSPLNITNDLLLGASATKSATFAFANVAGGTPTASISAGTGNNATYLTGAGILATTNGQTLTLGGGGTGNIVLNSAATSYTLTGLGTGIVQANNGFLSTQNVNLSSEVSNTLGVGNGGTGATTFTSNGILYGNGTSALQVTAAGTNGQLLEAGAGGTPTWVSTSSVNFWQLNNGALSPLNITNDLLLGASATKSATFAFANVAGGTPTASISAGTGNNATYLTGAGILATTNGQTLTLGGGGTGNIVLNSAATSYTLTGLGTGIVQANNGFLSTQNVNLSSEVSNTLGVGNGGTGATTFTSNGILYGNGTSALQVTAAGTNGQLLEAGAGGTPTWVSTSSVNFWQLNNGALSPLNITNDLLLGASATKSATFAFANVAGGTPTASISAGTGNNATYLTGAGILATTNGQTLTLGGGGTGNIVLNSAASSYTLNGITSGVLQSNNGLISEGQVNLSSEVSNTLGVGNGGTGATTFTSNGILYGNGASALQVTAAGTNGQLLEAGAGGTPTWVTTSSLNYWQLNNGALAPLNTTNDLLLGSTATKSATFAFANVAGGTPTASISAGTGNNATYLTGAGILATTNGQTLTLGGGGTGNIVLNSAATSYTLTGLGTGIVQANNGFLSTQNVNLSSEVSNTLGVGNGGTGITSLAAGAIAYGNGTTNPFATLAPGTTGQFLTSNGGTLSWESTSSVNYWQLNNGALSPLNITNDLLLGASATKSATFAFANVAGGTPTASISAGTGNNATYLTGAGILATTNGQTLTLGGGGTGNIVLNSAATSYTLTGLGTGIVQANNGFLSTQNVNLSSEVSNTLGVGNGGTGITSLAAGAIAYGNGTTNPFATLAPGTTGQFLTSNGGTLSWESTSSVNYWQLNNGALAPLNTTNDLLLGSTATKSATFAFANVAGGTPTASISAGTGNNATYLTGAGILATTNGQTLTLGGGGTGNIVLNSAATSYTLTGLGTGIVQANNGFLSTQNVNLSSEVSNTLGVGNGGTGITSLAAGAIAYGNGTTNPFATLAPGTTGQFLTSNGGTLSWESTSSVNYWQLNNGALAPLNTTNDLLLGSTATKSATFAFANVAGGTPTASISAGTGNNATYLTGAGILATTNGQTLTLGGGGTGNIVLNSAATSYTLTGLGTGIVQANNGFLSTQNVNLSSEVSNTLGVGNGGTGITSLAAGAIAYGNGTTNPFATLAPGTTGQFLTSNGGTLSWESTSSVNYWQLNNGALSPLNITNDLLLGASATKSATFAFANVAGGTPTASISAGTGNNATYLTGAGILATTNGQTLTLGGGGTGNIVLNSAATSYTLTGLGTGIVQANNGFLSTQNVNLSSEVSNTLGVGNGGTGATTFTSNGILYGNGTSALQVTAAGTNGQLLEAGAGGTPTWVSTSSVNFWQLNNGALSPLNITNDLLLGASATKSATFAFANVAGGTPTASISAGTGNNATYLTGAGILATTNGQTLTLGGGGTGNIVLNSAASSYTLNGITSGVLQSNNGLISEGQVNLSSEVSNTLGVGNGGTGITSLAAGAIAYGNGTTNPFATLAPGTTGQFLTSNGGTLSWESTSSVNYWQLSNGALSPLNLSNDLLLGSSATSSATFAFANVAGGTPTASISAGTGNNATYLTGAGLLGTTNNQSLTLGAAGTGNITLSPLNGSGVLNLNLASLSVNSTLGQSIGSASCVTTTDGIVTGTGVCPGGGGGGSGNYWQVNNGALSPIFTTTDILIGSTATKSATFAFTNVDNGTPTASISAGTGNNATYLTGAGLLGTTNNQSLTLGAAGTGNITLSPLNGSGVLNLNLASLSVNSTLGQSIGSASCVTTTDGIVTGTGSCSGSGTGNYWQVNNGALSPIFTTTDILIGSTATKSATFAFANVAGGTPTASISAGTGNNATYLTGAGILATTNGQTLTLGGGGTGNIVLNSAASSYTLNGITSGVLQSNNGLISEGQVNLSSEVSNTLGVGNGGTGITSLAAGAIAYGNGTTNPFATLAPGTTGQFLTSNGGTLSWESSSSVNYWQLNNGALSPLNITNDLLLGASATKSATFAFANVAGGTPTASISAGTGNNATYLTGAGILATTNGQTLTLGGGGTGNIVLNSAATSYTLTGLGTGIVQANNGFLSTQNVNLSSEVSNTLGVGNGGTGATTFTSNGILYGNGTSALQVTAAGTNGQLLEAGAGGTPTWVSTSSVNFWQLNNGALSPLNITNDLLLGASATKSATFAFANVAGGTPTASISAGTGNNATYLTGAGILATTNGQTLTLGGGGTGNIVLNSAASSYTLNGITSGVLQSNNGLISEGQVNLSSEVSNTLGVGNGGTGITSLAAGAIAYGNGTTNPFATLAPGTTGQFLTSNGGTLSWESSSSVNFWQLNNGALSPLNITNDLLLGASATKSATFAFANVAGGTPTASISAGTGNNATYLTGAGILATTNGQTLTLGGGGTGNIVLNSAASSYTLNGITSGVLQSNNGLISEGQVNLSSEVSNTLGVGNGGTGITSLAAGAIAYGNGTTNPFATLAPGTTGQFLTSNGGTLSWESSSSVNYWQLNNGALSPLNITNDLLLGASATKSATFAFANVAGGTPTASISAGTGNNATYLTGAGILATTNGQTLTLGGGGTGNIVLNSAASSYTLNGITSGVLQSNNGLISEGQVNLSSEVSNTLGVGNGGTGITSLAAGAIAYGNGTTNPFATLAPGTTGQFLTSNGGTLSWESSSSVNFWQLNNGALSPLNITNDLLLGASATKSATFAFANVAGGTPTASISAGTGNNATYLTGAGILATTNGQTLTLGGGGTGNIVLNSAATSYTLTGLGTGIVQANNGFLSTQNVNLSSEVSNTLGVGNGGTGATTFTSNGILYGNGTSALQVTAAGTNGQLLEAGAGGTPTWVSTSSVNFWQLNNGALSPLNITNDLLLGASATKSATFAFANVAGGTPTASISAGTGNNATYLTGAGILATTNGQTLTLGGGGTGNIVLNSAATSYTLTGLGTGIVQANNGFLSTQNVNLSSEVSNTLGVGNGGTGATTFTSNGILYGNGTSALQVTAAGTNGQLLEAGAGGTPTWVSTSSVNFWQLNNGALSPLNITNDLLLGASATKSATFAFANVAGGTPTASISAGTGNNATYLTGAGILATTNGQTLTLGGGGTGNIVLNSAASSYTLNGITSGVLQSNNGLISEGQVNLSSEVSNTLGVGNGGTGATTFTSNGILYGNGASALQVTAAGTNGQLLEAGAGGTPTWVSTSSVNYWQLNNGALAPLNTTNDLLLGSTATKSATFAFANVAGGTPTASISAGTGNNATYLTGAGILATTNGQTLTLGGGGTGNIVLNSAATSYTLTGLGTGIVQANNGFLSTQNVNLSSEVSNTLGVGNGGTGATTFTSNGILYGNGTSALQVTAAGTNGQLLEAGAGGTPTWVSTSSVNFWQLNNGALSPLNITNDLLLGGTATSSAEFAVTGIDTATPIASISAVINGGNKNGISLNASTTTIQSVNQGTLTIGGNTTGNITLAPLNGAAGSVLNVNAATVSISGAINQNSSATSTFDSNTILLGGTNPIITTANNNYLAIDPAGNGNIIFNKTSTPLASVDIRANTGTLAIASVSGATSFAALTVDNSGLGDIFTASSSGLTRMVVTQNGNVGIGTNLPGATLDVNGNIELGANGKFDTRSGGNLSIGTSNAHTIIIGQTGQAIDLPAYGGNDNSVLYADSSVNGVVDAVATTNQQNLCLLSSVTVANVPGWGRCDLGTTSWVQANGSIFPGNSTEDFFVGGTSTASAQFSVLGMSLGTSPTASISATAGANQGNGIVIAGNGNIQSLRNNTLTIGGSTTGDITLAPLNGAAGSVLNVNAATVSISGAINQTGSANSTFDSNSITLGGTNPQIITTGNNYLALDPAGTGNIIFNATTAPLASVDIRANSGTEAVASVSGKTSFASLVVNNTGSGDLFTASSSGQTRFTIQQNGIVQIGSTTNGLTFNYLSGGPTYTGTARPTKAIDLSPEYAGAILIASGSSQTNGLLTDGASPSATPNSFNWENYYQWTSSQTSQLQDYTVAVSVTLPKDFSAWATASNAIQIDFNTALISSSDNALDVYIYKKGDATGIPVYFSTNNVSGAQRTWTDVNISAAQLQGTTQWNAAGQEAVIYLKMHAWNSNYVQVGDIKLNYLSSF